VDALLDEIFVGSPERILKAREEQKENDRSCAVRHPSFQAKKVPDRTAVQQGVSNRQRASPFAVTLDTLIERLDSLHPGQNPNL
jgi:hypothetical protein